MMRPSRDYFIAKAFDNETLGQEVALLEDGNATVVNGTEVRNVTQQIVFENARNDERRLSQVSFIFVLLLV